MIEFLKVLYDNIAPLAVIVVILMIGFKFKEWHDESRRDSETRDKLLELGIEPGITPEYRREQLAKARWRQEEQDRERHKREWEQDKKRLFGD